MDTTVKTDNFSNQPFACSFGPDFLVKVRSVMAGTSNRMHLFRRLFDVRMGAKILVLLLSMSLLADKAYSNELPELGNTSSQLVSIQQEKVLGQAWLRALLRQAKTYDDPIVFAYLSQLVYSLAPSSSVIDKDFRFVILDSKALNAFAVPGSVIGINSGLFLHAVTEQEFASVMGHELAHVSQRHYARRLEQQQKSTPLQFASLLASVLIAATAGSEAGVAALASSQALSVEKQLSYSRQNEEEADRIGIRTIFDAGYDPRAMPVLFERMYRQSRLQGNQLPEYLSTHPLSEKRIADTRARATQFPRRNYRDNIEYHISQSLVINHYAESEAAAQQYFQSVIDNGNSVQVDGAHFGLAVAIIQSDPKRSEEILNTLLNKHPGHISMQLKLSEALYNQGKRDDAIALLETLDARNPDNYPISVYLTETYMDELRYEDAAKVLVRFSRAFPESTIAWYLRAENSGKVGDIVDVHQSRAEYFVLTNRLNQAMEQLRFAESKTSNEQTRALIKKRLDEVATLKEESPF